MIQEIVEAIVADMKTKTAFTGIDIVAAYDLSFDLDTAEGDVIVVAGGDASISASGPGGKAVAWSLPLTVTAATHQAIDKNGAKRKANAAKVFSYFLSVPGITITGYSFPALTERRESGVSAIGESYLGVSTMATLIVMSA